MYVQFTSCVYRVSGTIVFALNLGLLTSNKEQIHTGAVVQRCFEKKVFLKKACNFIKKETLEEVFSCEFSEISKKTFLYRIPLAAASVHTNTSNRHITQNKCSRVTHIISKTSKEYLTNIEI